MTGRPSLVETSTHGSVLVRGVDVVEETLDSITAASDSRLLNIKLEEQEKERQKSCDQNMETRHSLQATDAGTL